MAMDLSSAVDAAALEREIATLRQQLEDAEQLQHAIMHGEVDAFVVGPTDDAKRVLMLSGAYARYRQLVEDMQQGAVTVTRRGEILFANHAFAELLGLQPIDLFRAPLLEYVAAADRPALERLILPRPGQPDAKATLVSGALTRRVRISLVSSNDDFSTLLFTRLSEEDEEAGATVDAIRTGAVDALVVGGDQVVMLDSAQRFYQAAVERMQQGVIIIGAGGEIAYANQRMGTMLAMGKERLAALTLHKLVLTADHPALAPLLEARNGSAQARVRLRRSDGEVVAALITVSAMADGQKMCLVSDLSLKQRHEATDERTRKFLGMMAHEFRNILGPVRHSVDYLKRVEGLDANCRKMVEIVDRQTNRLLQLVEDLRKVNPKE